MNRHVKDLVLLQEIDSEKRGLQQQQEDIPRRSSGKRAALEQKEKALTEKYDEIKAIQRSIDGKELDLKEREEHVLKLQTQLKQAKTNKEYSVFTTEINGIKANCSLIEDDVLQMMSDVENMEAECAAMEDELAKEKESLASEMGQLDEALQIVNDNLRKLDLEREEISSRVNREFLDQYERLLQNRDGVAIVSAEDQVCHACHMSLTLQTMNDLRTSHELISCLSCGRILYLEEAE